MPTISINGQQIGSGHPVFIVAEMSCNHRQRIEDAIGIMQAAKEAGADAIKIQAYDQSSMTIDCQSEAFYISEGPWKGRYLWALYAEAATPWEWLPALKTEADRLGIILFPSVFSVDDLPKLTCVDFPAYKIASFELADVNLISAVARLGKPIILSTGMASIDDIWAAIKVAKEVALLKCTSAYPAPATEANLRTIEQMRYYQFTVPIGLSDHTRGIAVPVAAVALGTSIVEKHLCLDRSLGGLDAAFSLEPHEFKEMVEAIRIAEQAIGVVHYGPTESEKPMLRFRRSLFVVENVEAGEVFTPQNVRSIRPADGLEPRYYDDVIGKRTSRDIERGTPLEWGMIGV